MKYSRGVSDFPNLFVAYARAFATRQLFETTEGVTRETTAEQLAKLKADVAEIRQTLIEEGIAVET